MKILIDINHPAHVHYFKNVIKIMENKGHEFLVISRNKEIKKIIEEIRETNYSYFDFNYNLLFDNDLYSGIVNNLIKFHIWHKEFID